MNNLEHDVTTLSTDAKKQCNARVKAKSQAQAAQASLVLQKQASAEAQADLEQQSKNQSEESNKLQENIKSHKNSVKEAEEQIQSVKDGHQMIKRRDLNADAVQEVFNALIQAEKDLSQKKAETQALVQDFQQQLKDSIRFTQQLTATFSARKSNAEEKILSFTREVKVAGDKTRSAELALTSLASDLQTKMAKLPLDATKPCYLAFDSDQCQAGYDDCVDKARQGKEVLRKIVDKKTNEVHAVRAVWDTLKNALDPQ